MERFYWVSGRIGLALLAAAVAAGEAAAQQRQRMVYNPVTRQTEPESRSAAPARPARKAAPRAVAETEPQGVEQAALLSPACDDGLCLDCPTGACGDLVDCCSVPSCSPPGFFAGFEFTFVKPRFESNVAFTTTDSNATGDDVITDTEFDYDLELTPRVYVGVNAGNGVAFRATWWQFDNQADQTSGAPADAFGLVSHPAFGDVNINATAPDETLSAATDLNAYSIDLEIVRESSFLGWDLEVGGGVRYSVVEQGYTATLSDGTALGQINFLQSLEGIGPTISLGASTPLTRRLSLFSRARGSLLFGDGETRLSALETGPTVTTDQVTSRDDLLSIAEVQLGFHWQGDCLPRSGRRPFATFAMEGQAWNGAGSATSEDGTLGFFGFTTEIGLDW